MKTYLFLVIPTLIQDLKKKQLFINSVKKEGTLLNKVNYNYFTTTFYVKDSILYTLSVDNETNTDIIRVFSFSDNLQKINEIKKKLPINGFFSKENYKVDTLKNKIKKVFYTKIPACIYDAKDFIVDNEKNFIITGSSNNNLWIAKLVNDSIVIDWSMNYIYNKEQGTNSSYHKFNNIQQYKDFFYVSGICVYDDNLFNDWIKLFIFKVRIINE